MASPRTSGPGVTGPDRNVTETVRLDAAGSADRVVVSAALEMAVRAAHAAGSLLQQRVGPSLDIVADAAHDIKLAVDREADDAIAAVLRTGPPWPVLSEERGFNGSAGRYTDVEWCWVVDPLDGTVNFARTIPIWSISIALCRHGEPVLGVVHVPAQHESFTGIVGSGAWRNGDAMRVSDVDRTSNAILCTGVPVAADFSDAALVSFAERIRSFKKVRLLGSAAISLAYVAAGRADAYYERDIRVWDVAAGVALVRAAGGTATMTPMTDHDRMAVFAGNGRINAIS